MREFNQKTQEQREKSVQHPVTQYLLFDFIAHRKHQNTKELKQSYCCSANYH